MYNSNNVAAKIKYLAKDNGYSIKKLLEDVGLGFNTMSNMKTSMPKADNLAKIADYLNCSVDYLLGRTDNTELNSEHNLSDQEEKLIDAFRSTDELGRMRIIQFVMNESDKTTVKMVADNKNSIPPIVRKKPRHT